MFSHTLKIVEYKFFRPPPNLAMRAKRVHVMKICSNDIAYFRSAMQATSKNMQYRDFRLTFRRFELRRMIRKHCKSMLSSGAVKTAQVINLGCLNFEVLKISYLYSLAYELNAISFLLLKKVNYDKKSMWRIR